MTNTYAINCTRGKEFTVEGELQDMGLHPWVPRMLASKYIKEQRRVKWYDRPYVSKLIFCVIPAIYWPDVVKLKHVIGKPKELSWRDMNGDKALGAVGLIDFQRAVAAEYSDMERKRANSEYECQFEPGQAVEMLLNQFTELPAVFKEAVKQAHDEYAKLRCDVEMMGRTVSVEVDPDQVKAVDAR